MWLIPWLWGIVVGTVVIAGLLVFWNVRAHRRRNVLVDDGAADRRFHSGLDQGLIAGAVLALTIGYSLGLQALGVSRFALSISDLLWLLLGGVLLVISFLAGLLFQSSKAGSIPVLGYPIGLFFWHAALPWQEFSTITGDLGWTGYVLVPGIPSLFMYFSFLLGRVLR